jgi:hypothetical protein
LDKKSEARLNSRLVANSTGQDGVDRFASLRVASPN